MANPYPVVSHRETASGELTSLSAEPGRALVLDRTDERLVTLVGSESAPLSDHVRAVTEVDVRERVELRARTRLREGPWFTRGPVIRVVFHCTVTDPAAVAQARTGEALADLPVFLTDKVALVALDTRRTTGFNERLKRLLQVHLEPHVPGAAGLKGRLLTRRFFVPGLTITVSPVDSPIDLPSLRPPGSRSSGAGPDSDLRLARSMNNWQ